MCAQKHLPPLVQHLLVEGALRCIGRWDVGHLRRRIPQLLHDAGGSGNHGGGIARIGRDDDGIGLAGHLLRSGVLG